MKVMTQICYVDDDCVKFLYNFVYYSRVFFPQQVPNFHYSLI